MVSIGPIKKGEEGISDLLKRHRLLILDSSSMQVDDRNAGLRAALQLDKARSQALRRGFSKLNTTAEAKHIAPSTAAPGLRVK
jgi:hypothetical protein